MQIAFVLLLFMLLAGWLLFFQWRSVFRPGRAPGPSPADTGLRYEELFFVSEDDVTLRGWWVPHDQARGTILLLNGNAGNLHDRVELIRDLAKLGANVFAFEYRGYGRSRGWPTEQGTYRDARAAYEVVRARHGDAESPPILLLGISLGGAVAVQLALDRPVRGLVVENTFTSIAAMARLRYPAFPLDRLLVFRYDSLAKVSSLRVPLLVAHSANDEVIPYAMGQALYEAAPGPKRFERLSGIHSEIGWRTNPGYWQAVEEFADRVLPRL